MLGFFSMKILNCLALAGAGSLLCLDACAQAPSAGFPVELTSVFFNAAATSYGNNIPIHDLEGRWQGFPNRSGDSHAFQSLEVESGVGVSWRGRPSGQFSAVVRNEGFLNASQGVALAAAAIQNSENFQNVPYQPAELQFRQYLGYGIRFRSPWLELAGVDGPDLRMSLDLLQLRKIRSAELSGQLGIDQGVAQANLTGYYASSDRKNDFLSSGESVGWGGSVSLEGCWQVAEQILGTVIAKDVISSLRWNQVYTESGVIDTETRYTDAAGFSQFKPAISGTYFRKNILSQIPVTLGAALDWHSADGSWQATGAASHRWSLWQVQTRVGRRWGPSGLSLGYDWVSRSLQLQASWRSLTVSAGMDKIGRNSQFRSLGLAWTYSL